MPRHHKSSSRTERLLAILARRAFDGRGWRENVAVLVEDGRIRALLPWGEVPEGYPERTLPEGSILVPGFIDLQVNGGGGILLNDDPTGEAMLAIARAHRRFGTTACLPTLITDTRERTQAAIQAARAVAGRDGVLGLHLEGPFLSPARPGVHRPDLIAEAKPEDLEWLTELAGAGRSLVTLAPECVPAGFVKALAARGIRVAAGHSEASAETVGRAVEDGLSGITHLFNAMPPLSARSPGIIGAALADPRLTAGLIVDGIHVDPVAVRTAFAAKGAGGIALVTDAMPTVGSASTQFDLMGRRVTLAGGRLSTPDGTLAGAHLDMATAVRKAVRLAGIPLEDALCAASATPACFLGLERERGFLAPGARADFVLLTPGLEVSATWVDGVEQGEG
jgi:N-acetylglucosamine-6-phosphate deacetylase